MHQNQSRRSSRHPVPLLLVVVLAGLALSGTIAAIIGAESDTAQSSCEEAVNAYLKVAGRFERVAFTTPNVENVFTVAGSVDSINETGSLEYSGGFFCNLTVRQDGTWHVIAVVLSPNPVVRL